MLGENLKYLRLKKGLSQDYVAKYLDKKSFTTIQKWESNISEPSLKDTRKLCRPVSYTHLTLPTKLEV